MNPNTNAVPNTSTTTSGPGSGIGSRFRGAAEVIHGAGEGVRGTFLGAVDTVVKNGPTQNDEIARQGRLEVERGMAKMRGQGTAAGPTAYGNGTSTASSNTDYNAPHATGATHMPGSGAGTTGGGALHPNHHREDAVVGIPQDELRDVQSHAPQSYSQTQEPHSWNTNANGVNPTTHGAGFANANNASADYAPGLSAGGTYGPAGNDGRNPSDYPHQAHQTVAKDKQFNAATGGLARDQGPGGRGMGVGERDGRTGLN